MLRSLQSYETGYIEDSDTSSSSSSSEFDLLNLEINYNSSENRRQKKNRKTTSDSSSYKTTEALSRTEQSPVHASVKHEISVSDDGQRSSSLQSFQFPELSESREFDSPPKPFINEVSHHKAGINREVGRETERNKVKQVTFSNTNQAHEAVGQKYKCVTSSSYRNRAERARRPHRIRSPLTKTVKLSSKSAPSKADKGTQIPHGWKRQGSGSHSDTDKSTVELFRGPVSSARPARSVNSLTDTGNWIRGKQQSPRFNRQPCSHSSDRRRPKYKMAQQQTSPKLYKSPQDSGALQVEGPAAAGEMRSSTLSGKESDESKRVFPFQATPSGNLKIVPNQVVFESKRVSVLVADPKRTKVNVKEELGNKSPLDAPKKSSVQVPNVGQPDGPFQIQQRSDDDFYPNEMGDDFVEDVESSEDPELNLARLGFTSSEPIDWSKITLPNKSDLYKLLHYRITNYINPDCVVRVGKEEFNCHHLVLRCYSTYFDKQFLTEVELPESSVSPKAFSIIYDWMIFSGLDSYQLLRRDNILEIFMASHFLGIKELEEQCWAFIDSEQLLAEDTAFLLYLDAKKHGYTEIMDMMIPRIIKFFLTLVSSKDFLELSIDELCVLLRSSYISVHSEMEVFMSAVRWLMHGWEQRKEHVIDVMSTIRFGLIAPWQLVDIRRNPENPEFIEISSFSEVQQLVEDGLAYAIIKYWYGSQTQDYFHWIDLLSLTEPTPRNWIGEDKNYVTYREFLRDLDGYRRSRILEKKRSKTQKMRTLQSLESQAMPSMAQSPTVLSPREASKMLNRPVSMLSSSLAALIPPPPSCRGTTDMPPQHVESHPSAMEDFLIRREYVDKHTSIDYINQDSQLMYRDGGGDVEVETEEYEETMTDMRSDDDGIKTIGSTELENQAKEVLQAQEERELKATQLSSDLKLKQQSLQIQIQKEPHREASSGSVDFKDSQISTDSTDIPYPQNTPIKHSPLIFLSDTKDISRTCAGTSSVPVYSFSSDRSPARNLRQMSVSVLGPVSRDYLAEGSLFLADREAVLVFGGVDPHSQYGIGRNTGKDIYRYQPEANSWEFVGELPEPRHHHSVAFLKGRVYLVGGADPRNDDLRGKSVVVSTVWSYEPVTRAWFSESGMLTPRKNFGLVVSNGKLYAIGGQDRQGRVLASVERFDPVTSVWEQVAPLDIGRMGVAATKFRDLIWVAGGMTASKRSPLCRNVECYDTRCNVWKPFNGLRFPRCFGHLFTMNDTLYLIGGAGRLTERDRTTSSVGAIDIWDAQNKQWCLQSEMTIPRHGHSIAYLGTQILIIGGVTTVYMRALSNVECFCCERGTWIRGVSNLPTTLSGHGSITLPPASLM